MPRTVRVVFGLSILITTKTWRVFMSAFLHGQPSLRAVFSRQQVVLHEQDCIQIKTIGQWSVFRIEFEKYTQNTPLEFHQFHYVSRHHLGSVRFHFCQMGSIRVYRTIPCQQTSPEISVSVSISSPRSEAMPKYKLSPCFDRNGSNNGYSGQWPRLTTNNAQSVTVSDKGSLKVHVPLCKVLFRFVWGRRTLAIFSS